MLKLFSRAGFKSDGFVFFDRRLNTELLQVVASVLPSDIDRMIIATRPSSNKNVLKKERQMKRIIDNLLTLGRKEFLEKCVQQRRYTLGVVEYLDSKGVDVRPQWDEPSIDAGVIAFLLNRFPQLMDVLVRSPRRDVTTNVTKLEQVLTDRMTGLDAVIPLVNNGAVLYGKDVGRILSTDDASQSLVAYMENTFGDDTMWAKNIQTWTDQCNIYDDDVPVGSRLSDNHWEEEDSQRQKRLRKAQKRLPWNSYSNFAIYNSYYNFDESEDDDEEEEEDDQW